jgi:hypothetical protein
MGSIAHLIKSFIACSTLEEDCAARCLQSMDSAIIGTSYPASRERRAGCLASCARLAVSACWSMFRVGR